MASGGSYDIPGECLESDSTLKSPSSDVQSLHTSSSPPTLQECVDETLMNKEQHNHSLESSDSIETLAFIPDEDSHVEINQQVLEKLSINANPNRTYLEPSCDKQRHRSSHSDTSGDSHEVISESCNVQRPESLSITSSLRKDRSKSDQTSDQSKSEHSKDPKGRASSEADAIPIEEQGAYCIDRLSGSHDSNANISQGLPQGTITRHGDMIQFVAADLTEKIKLSSPKSLAGRYSPLIKISDSDSFDSRRSSLRSIISASSSTSAATSSAQSRSPSRQWQQSPDDIPPIDASAVADLEARALRAADSVDLMMGNIRSNLHKMSAITIGCQEAYKRSVDITCDSVDGSIKAMYALMAKCEELSTSMQPVDQLAGQIKEIKRILELFETQLSDK